MMKMRKALFIIGLLIASGFPFAFSATDEGYGEDQTALGQFVDSFENLNNVSITYQVERNSTLNAMELNYTSDVPYRNFEQTLSIYINSSRIDEVLTDFPILIILNETAGITDFNSSIIFDEVGDSYQKIAITNSSFIDERYVEIEYWNATERIAWIWTHGEFSNTSDTLLNLHYDGDVANNTLFVDVPGSVVASNVWNSGFIAVWHFSENDEPYLDSTQFNNDAYKIGTVTRGDYQIDGGQNIVGINDGMTVDIPIGYDDLTFETWVDFDVLGVDRCLLSTWYVGGNSQGFIFYYDLAPTNSLRFLTDENPANGGTALVAFGDIPPNTDSFYYYAARRIRNDFVYGYEDAVETVGGATANVILPDGGANITIGHDNLARDFNGQMDETRISNVSRSPNWINASRFNGIDDLLTQGPGISRGGYQTDGYFTTEDYMNDTLCNGTALGLMINSTIPGNTDIQVQFSNDNVTWGDWEGTPLDSNILAGGFESIDLRYLNETDVYLRFNLSTTDNSITPRIYQARIISTIGNATAGPVSGPSGSGAIGFIMLTLICTPLIILLWGRRRR